jgi:hypothetical protein
VTGSYPAVEQLFTALPTGGVAGQSYPTLPPSPLVTIAPVGVLSERDLEDSRRDGYVCVAGAFTRDIADECRSRL